MAVSTDLVSWLRSQLDTDEEIARIVSERYVDVRDGSPYWPLKSIEHRLTVMNTNPAIGAGLDLIKRYGPAHVLRTVAAHRAILDRHSPTSAEPWVGPPLCRWCDIDSGPWPCPDVLSLLSIYDSRPGFDPSWRAE